MATKEKDDISAPVAILLLFLAFAFAAGGLEGIDDGGGGGGCWEEFQTSEPTEPDEDGVRWWGVHQWVDGELILNGGRIADPPE